MDYYYTDAQNQPRGPVSVEQLRELMSTGQVNAATQVAAVGSQNWVPITTVLAGAGQGGGLPYGGTPGGPGGPIVQAGQTEPLAIWSLVLGILSMLCCTFLIVGAGAVVTGHLALSSLKKNPTRQGRGMAIAGLVMGYLSIVIGVLALAFGMVQGIMDAARTR